jgi:hypothetical protein
MNEKIQPPPYRAGHYPWDLWEQSALERGMERTLAQLGRDVVRDADQHAWSEPLQQLCEGESLADLLIRAPYLGRRLCEILLETDGLRVAYTEDGKKSTDLIFLAGFEGGH